MFLSKTFINFNNVFLLILFLLPRSRSLIVERLNPVSLDSFCWVSPDINLAFLNLLLNDDSDKSEYKRECIEFAVWHIMVKLYVQEV